MLRLTHLVIVSLLCLSTAGCFGPPAPALAPVKGRVTYQGKPVPYGQVMFQPPSGEPARGEIQADGSYILSTFVAGDGATVGKNHVRITSIPAQKPEAAAQAAKGELSSAGSTIPKRYSDFSTSGLEIDVKPSANPDVDFVLED